MLKADMHMHSREDQKDIVDYTAKELIDHLASLNFNVMALTFHDQSFKSEEAEKYAKSKGIIIIPGIERRIEGVDILIYNVPHEKVIGMKTLDDLKKISDENLQLRKNAVSEAENIIENEMAELVKIWQTESESEQDPRLWH